MSSITGLTSEQEWFLSQMEDVQRFESMLAKTVTDFGGTYTGSSQLKDTFATFRDLSERLLFTLRLEVFLHVGFHLGLYLDEVRIAENFTLMPSKGDFMDVDNTNVDAYILALTNDLLSGYQLLESAMPAEKLLFIFEGIDLFISNALIRHCGAIQIISDAGVHKMVKGIRTIQHHMALINVTEIVQVEAPDELNALDRARVFYKIMLSTLPVRNFCNHRSDTVSESARPHPRAWRSI